MLSASSHPVTVFGSFNLPPILPVNATLYAVLRSAHYLLALAFFALILGHVAAALGHKLIRNDGVFEAMAGGSNKR
jgi:cytochrome b561